MSRVETPADGPSHVPALDGLRGLAILLVLCYHANVLNQYDAWQWPFFSVLRAGWAGVDLFFVLSGFLITGILLATRGSRGYFRSFYARRMLRIFPLYYLFLALVLWILPALLGTHSPELTRLRDNQAWLWTYLTNVRIALSEGFQDTPLKMGHLWSLAVEEQFYLVWPFVVWYCPTRALRWVCVGLLALAPALRLGLGLAGWGPHALYVSTPTRMDPLLIGALIALARRSPTGFARLVRPSVWALGACGALLLAIVIHYGRLGHLDPPTQRFGYTALALFFGGLLVQVLLLAPGSPAHRVFTAAPLTSLGRYSYAMYLVNEPLNRVLDWAGAGEALKGAPPLLGQLVYLAASVGLAYAGAFVSWRLVESPFLSLKRLFPYGRPVAAPLTPA